MPSEMQSIDHKDSILEVQRLSVQTVLCRNWKGLEQVQYTAATEQTTKWGCCTCQIACKVLEMACNQLASTSMHITSATSATTSLIAGLTLATSATSPAPSRPPSAAPEPLLAVSAISRTARPPSAPPRPLRRLRPLPQHPRPTTSLSAYTRRESNRSYVNHNLWGLRKSREQESECIFAPFCVHNNVRSLTDLLQQPGLRAFQSPICTHSVARKVASIQHSHLVRTEGGHYATSSLAMARKSVTTGVGLLLL